MIQGTRSTTRNLQVGRFHRSESPIAVPVKERHTNPMQPHPVQDLLNVPIKLCPSLEQIRKSGGDRCAPFFVIGTILLIIRAAIGIIRDVGEERVVRNPARIHDGLTLHEIEVALPTPAFCSFLGVVVRRVAIYQSLNDCALARAFLVFS